MPSQRFQQLPLDKWQWHPSPIPGQVVYVLTKRENGATTFAPKSWVSMAAFSGPILGFGCSADHETYKNVQRTRRFTISFPNLEQAEVSFAVAAAPREERLDVSGMTLQDSPNGGVGHLAECPAYCELALKTIVPFDDGEAFLFGQIQHLYVDGAILDLPRELQYERLRPAFFLEPDVLLGLANQ